MCNTKICRGGSVCANCFKQLAFTVKPFCQLCARPFISEVEAGKNFICTECEQNLPLWNHCRAAFLYNEGIKKLIMPLKYGDQQRSLGFLSYFMYCAAQDLLDQIDYIIPVPLHKKRLRYRKYNQSALLAWQLGRRAKIKVLPMGLLRIKETVSLGHLGKNERQFLLKGSFKINPQYQEKLLNKNVLLIDDVMTTGTTLNECTLTLLESQIASVDVLVAAKVV